MLKISLDSSKLNALAEKLSEDVLNGIDLALNITTSKMRGSAKESDLPATYVPGRMDAIFKEKDHSGKLADYTSQTAGKLREAWINTLDDIKMDRRYKGKAVFNLFNSRHLQESTPWVGISDNIYNKGKRGEKIRNTELTMSDAAIRPIGSSKNFKWMSNPYAGYGYWMLYESGYETSYNEHSYIRPAYSSLLGNSSERILDETARLEFSPEFLKLCQDEASKATR